MADSVFNQFTNKYPLSKTLRFELKPVRNTLENMQKNLCYDEKLQTFLKDQHIEDAYQTLKPYMDELHERFINESLQSKSVKAAPFVDYINTTAELLAKKSQFKSKQAVHDDPEIKVLLQSLEKQSEALRKSFNDAYQQTGEDWKLRHTDYEWKKGNAIAKGAAILSCKDVLAFIKDSNETETVHQALKEFDKFFTYFSGFNQNRENYYETDKEAATAVATRVVHENLPRFTDNVLAFEARQDEYKSAYTFLMELGKILPAKNGKNPYPIEKSLFSRTHFNDCLAQSDIETYNLAIGNANFLVNLYNQAKGQQDFKRLPTFKTLYKQIGCGKNEALFFAIDREEKGKVESDTQSNDVVSSVEEVLDLARDAGQQYFVASSDRQAPTAIPEFAAYITSQESYTGFYWSKVALNTISGKYFANWHDLKDRLQQAAIFKKASRGDIEDVKIPEVVELQGFFEVLNSIPDWQTTLFKDSIVKDKNELIVSSVTASGALLAMIASDLTGHAEAFLALGTETAHITKKYFSLPTSDKAKGQLQKEWKEIIKAWLEEALAVNRILKYFQVRENKIRGSSPVDSQLSEMLKTLLDIEWFKWYDALRNYLTKKPQDDAQENKLKLNFENSNLLGGWSDGQEKSKAAVLLRKDNLYYLGILRAKNLFDTAKENNAIYKDTTPDSGRLILANLKFQVLAGKGFLGKFGKSYGEMGKNSPEQAIGCLQNIIKERYEDRYPLLKKIAERTYTNKKEFDKDIQEALKESYVCEFRNIDWRKVEAFVSQGEMYLFQIYSKDFAQGKMGARDLQTIYWDSLFEETNEHQLNGGGEVFYRKQAIKELHVKPNYENKPWIIENRRFTEKAGKFFFHCPVKLNYKASTQSSPKYAFPYVNKYINESLSSVNDMRFLGIDRGEKHLGYYSLIDAEGNIHVQDTLNMPFKDKDGNPRTIKAKKRFFDENGKEQEVEVACKDYNDLLAARAGDRDYARKNWQTIGTIKELKEGYISQVVHQIAQFAVEQPTFLVLEDLNAGFMRGRQKIEKSVYKKFEVALLKKLNFVVDKTKDGKYDELRSVTKALQLTPPADNYEEVRDKGKQAGIMLFVRPDYTSQTDPVTGWRKTIYIGSGSESVVKERIIKAFTNIYFDGSDYVFEYTDALNRSWKLYSGKNGKSLDRFHRERKDKGEWTTTAQDLPAMFDQLFSEFDKQSSLLEQVKSGKNLCKINQHTAWESLRFAITLLQQIRNTGQYGVERDDDFILSPVRDKNGNHFDSRMYWDIEKDEGVVASLPSSGDANGAYNIARKGVILHEHIQRGFNLYIRDEEWDAWLAGKDVWETWIQSNIKQLKKGAR